MPSLFQIAAYFEDFFPAAGSQRSARPLPQTPVADFMLHPEKLKIWLRSAKTRIGGATKQRPKDQSSVRRAVRSVTSKDRGNEAGGKAAEASPRELRKIEFSLDAPAARSVRLAADFTDWNKNTINLVNTEGIWRAAIPLAPGLYSYRFIVDGRWCNDPHAIHQVPNPFGTDNSVILVT
jgi:hypothetical protein